MKKYYLVLALVAAMFTGNQLVAQDVVLNLTGMTPHIGQKFEARLVSKRTGKEEDREKVSSISGADFSVTLKGEVGENYFIDFYADLNQNGQYDAPPADHAWRMNADNLSMGSNNFTFSHATNFTDIEWKHELKFQLNGMTPHIGQAMGFRLVDVQNGKEAGREDLSAVPGANFNVDFPLLEPGHSYNLDFYADLNQNGRYDAPPADHAWRLSLGPVDGDKTLSFSHATNFTDIQWVYEFKLDFMNMTPHVGQKLELRVVNSANGEEAGRVSLPAILQPNFTLAVPGIEIGKNYNADFYADLNQNGSYDMPPTDHAWRLNFDDDDGDESLSFTHNTNFTDIGFPTTAIQEINGLSSWKVFPNPFRESFLVSVSLEQPARLSAVLYNMAGQKVNTLFDGPLFAGDNTFEGKGLDSMPVGQYYLVLSDGYGISVQKLIKQ